MYWTDWMTWIRQNWHALERGSKIFVRQSEIPHPMLRPDIFKPGIGFPDGQHSDYMLPLKDGSRIHVQGYKSASGTPTFRVHRDRWDPDRDLGSAIMHAAFETPFGPVFGLALVFGVFASTGR